LGIIIVGTLYFYPSYLAAKSNNALRFNITFLANLALGWTIIGWLACLLSVRYAVPSS